MKSPAMDKAYTSPKVSTEREILFWMTWTVLFAFCGLIALAIRDQERREQQLERVHAAGMAVGASLCERGLR